MLIPVKPVTDSVSELVVTYDQDSCLRAKLSGPLHVCIYHSIGISVCIEFNVLKSMLRSASGDVKN